MDLSYVGIAATSITLAKDLAKSAIGLRDFNAMALEISKMNEQLLKAQDALFTHNTQLLTLQQQLMEYSDEIRTLRAKNDERAKYVLHEISPQTYVYRTVTQMAAITGGFPDQNVVPIHHLCQPCFDKGNKAVLQRHEFYGSVSLVCPICKESFATKERTN